jgi:hypothetical protein
MTEPLFFVMMGIFGVSLFAASVVFSRKKQLSI